jgi:hypothetical protein
MNPFLIRLNFINKELLKPVALFLAITLLLFSLVSIRGERKEIVADRNEYGGETVEYSRDDFSILTIYLDGDGNKAKEEVIYTNDYPIDNDLARVITYYFFGKKVREETIFTSNYAARTLIKRTIDNYNRSTGKLLNSENYFIRPYSGYNVVFRESGKKRKIEWYYPEIKDGILKNINYLDDSERVVKTESYYSDKTALEKGYYKRVYYSSFNLNQYVRKSRQEWFYTKEYGKNNYGKFKKVELFHYSLGKPVRVEIAYYDQEGQYLGK